MKKRKNGEGSLFYNETLKRWQGQYKGKTIYQNLKENESPKDFARRFSKFKVEIDDDILIKKNTVILEDILTNYITQKYKDGKTSPRSFQRDKETLSALKKNCPKLLKKEIQKITIQDIEDSKSNIRKYSNSTIDKIWVLLKKGFSLSYNRRILNFNIMEAGIEKPISLKENIKVEALTVNEENMLRDILRKEKSDYSKIALFQLNTGMRAGELLARSFNDYDSKNHTLDIHNSLTQDENYKPIIGKHTKTYSKLTGVDLGKRIIPINQECEKIIKEMSKNPTRNIHNLIFWNYKKNNFYTVSSYNSYLLRLNEKYKITNRLTTHVLRHTRITRMQEQRIPLVVIQYCVGHVKGSSITNNIYTSVSLDFVRQELNLNKTKKGCK